MTAQRPVFTTPATQYLNSYAYLTGSISSAPLDLAKRMDTVYASLKALGWLIGPASVETDFSGPFGIPIPKTQPLTIFIHRKDRPYTLGEAQGALGGVLKALDMNYSSVDAWEGEVMQNVVQPSIRDAQKAAADAWSYKYVVLGAVGLLLVYKIVK